MFYTPKFCSNCGEKIERANRSVTDSEKFCDICKHDFVVPRMLPKIFMAVMAIFGMFGIGSYWRGGEKPLNVSAKQLTANQANLSKTPPVQTSQVISNSNIQPIAPKNVSPTNAPAANLTMKPPLKQTETAPVAATEATYFCGAATKKGTPCTRRVKGGGRCWQHKGQPALLPPEKLLASQ